jgi:uncharacterized protein YciI
LFAQGTPRKEAVTERPNQYVVLLKRGPNWIPNKPASEQPLSNHGRYLNEQMSKGVLLIAGPFLDDSGGLILYRGRDEAEVRAIAEHDPGVINQILAVEFIRPFQVAFDAATGKSPFEPAK